MAREELKVEQCDDKWYTHGPHPWIKYPSDTLLPDRMCKGIFKVEASFTLFTKRLEGKHDTGISNY